MKQPIGAGSVPRGGRVCLRSARLPARPPFQPPARKLSRFRPRISPRRSVPRQPPGVLLPEPRHGRSDPRTARSRGAALLPRLPRRDLPRRRHRERARGAGGGRSRHAGLRPRPDPQERQPSLRAAAVRPARLRRGRLRRRLHRSRRRRGGRPGHVRGRQDRAHLEPPPGRCSRRTRSSSSSISS